MSTQEKTYIWLVFESEPDNYDYERCFMEAFSTEEKAKEYQQNRQKKYASNITVKIEKTELR